MLQRSSEADNVPARLPPGPDYSGASHLGRIQAGSAGIGCCHRRPPDGRRSHLSPETPSCVGELNVNFKRCHVSIEENGYVCIIL